jgi:TetR/AcrR family transcriptional repressor of nem operon
MQRANFEELAKLLHGKNAEEKRKKAIALFSQMVGALSLSRAVVDVDSALADEILEDARNQLRHALRK